MKKLIFILFCIPFFVIGQSKKELKQTVVQYQDTISNLNSIIKSQKSSQDILKAEISDLDIEITEINNKNNSLIREKKKLVRDHEVSSKKE